MLNKSVQQQIDEEMCRPGYRWHGKPLNRCLPGGAIGYYDPSPLPSPPGPEPTPPTPPAPEPPPVDQPTPETGNIEQAIAKERAQQVQAKRKKNA